MPIQRPKPEWMKIPKRCAWEKCTKSFIPKQKHQKYCSKSHKVRASQQKKHDQGDIRVVKVCQFRNHPLDHQRCYLDDGHELPHRVKVWPSGVLDSKTGDVEGD